MTCEELEAIVFSGRAMTEQEKREAEAHAAHCEACRVLLEQQDVLSGMQDLDAQVEAPESFKQGWRRACRERVTLWDRISAYFGQGQMVRRAAVYACCAVVLFGAGALAGRRPMQPGADYGTARMAEMPMEEPASYAMPRMAADEAGGANMARSMGAPQEERKIIRTAEVNLRTKDLDAAVEALRTRTEALGGSVSTCEITGQKGEGRSAYLEMRLPSEQLDAAVSEMGSLGEVTRSRTASEDMTEVYTDNQARLESAKAQKAQLDKLYGQAEDMADILAIQDALFEVQMDIDRLSGVTARIDDQAENAQLTVSLRESPARAPQDEKPFFTALWDSLLEGTAALVSGLGGLVQGLAYGLPTIFLLGLVIFAVRWGIRRHRRK